MKNEIKPDSLIFSKSQQAHLKNLRESTEITENTILAVKKAMGNDQTFAQAVHAIVNTNSLRVTPAQFEKGITWLRDLWKTPRGVERKNCPFGNREKHVIENAAYITLYGFHNTSHYSAFYVPIYEVHTAEDHTFVYYVAGGDIHITN